MKAVAATGEPIVPGWRLKAGQELFGVSKNNVLETLIFPASSFNGLEKRLAYAKP
jgi:hypothetical protein